MLCYAVRNGALELHFFQQFRIKVQDIFQPRCVLIDADTTAHSKKNILTCFL